MKLNHPVFRAERKPKSTSEHCPMSPSGEHQWQNIPATYEGQPPIECLCVLCSHQRPTPL